MNPGGYTAQFAWNGLVVRQLFRREPLETLAIVAILLARLFLTI